MVGYGHLFGQDGIIKALLVEGYTLHRISDDGDKTLFTSENLKEIEARPIFNAFKNTLSLPDVHYTTDEIEKIKYIADIEGDNNELLGKLASMETLE